MGRLQEPLFVGLDTASSFLALALWSPGRGTVAAFCQSVGRDHAKRIIVELDKLAAGTAGGRSAIRGIGVGIGPGSYTGLRVGVAVAKGLACGLGIRVSGVETLAAIAWGALAEGSRGVATLDARRDNVYAAVYERRGPELELVERLGKVSRRDLKATFATLPILEGVAPDAAFIARAAYRQPGRPAEPVYL